MWKRLIQAQSFGNSFDYTSLRRWEKLAHFAITRFPTIFNHFSSNFFVSLSILLSIALVCEQTLLLRLNSLCLLVFHFFLWKWIHLLWPFFFTWPVSSLPPHLGANKLKWAQIGSLSFYVSIFSFSILPLVTSCVATLLFF